MRTGRDTRRARKMYAQLIRACPELSDDQCLHCLSDIYVVESVHPLWMAAAVSDMWQNRAERTGCTLEDSHEFVTARFRQVFGRSALAVHLNRVDTYEGD